MKICKYCVYFLDINKVLDPTVFETYPIFDRCAVFYHIEPIRGLRVNLSCVEARTDSSKCGPSGKLYQDMPG